MVIAVDLGGTKIRAGINDKGLIIDNRYTLLHSKESLDSTLRQLIDLLAPLVKPGIRGIGIGVPSIVDIENGIVYNVINIPSWERVELRAILENEFQLPVYVNNDVNCFVLGEHSFGEAKNFSNVVGLTLGTGLGSGIIINNQLYAGANCGAGEIGYLPYLDKNFEFYCGSEFFKTKYKISAVELSEKATQGNAEALNLWKEFGSHVGNAVKAVLYAYDPDAVVIGGSISKAFAFFQTSMKEALNDFLFPGTLNKVKILKSQNDDIQLLGAAALVK